MKVSKVDSKIWKYNKLFWHASNQSPREGKKKNIDNDRQLLFEEIMVEGCLELIKGIDIQIQESIAYAKKDIYK